MTDRLPSWLRWMAPLTRRMDRRRMGRWMRRRGRRAPQPQPQPQPRPARTIHGTGIFGPGPAGATGGSTMASRAQDVAEEIESFGSWTPDSPDDLHETLKHLSDINEAVSAAYHRIAGTLEETNVDPVIPETIHQAATSHSHITQDLDEQLSGGVMRRGG
jgi:hypothetical protein